MMDIEEMIKKWDEQIALHRRVCDDPLMYTKEERLKNSHYAQAICAVVADLKTEKTTEWTPAPEDIEEREKLPIDKVTTKNLDIALRMVGIQLDINIIDKVIDLVELIENKGDDVTIKDIVSLQQTWSRHSEAFH